MVTSVPRSSPKLKNSLLISLLAGSPTSKINDLYDTLATVATVIGDGWSGLKPDNSINPSRMLQRRALVAACGALGAPPPCNVVTNAARPLSISLSMPRIWRGLAITATDRINSQQSAAIRSDAALFKILQSASKCFEMLQIVLLQNASECCEMFRFDSFTPVHLWMTPTWQELFRRLGDLLVGVRSLVRPHRSGSDVRGP